MLFHDHSLKNGDEDYEIIMDRQMLEELHETTGWLDGHLIMALLVKLKNEYCLKDQVVIMDPGFSQTIQTLESKGQSRYDQNLSICDYFKTGLINREAERKSYKQSSVVDVENLEESGVPLNHFGRDHLFKQDRHISNFSQLKYLFTPVHLNYNHWSLIIVDFVKKEISYHDRFHTKPKHVIGSNGKKKTFTLKDFTYLGVFRNYLINCQKNMTGPKVDFAKFKLIACFKDYWAKTNADQKDTSSCGVFLCATVNNYMLEQSDQKQIEHFTQLDCPLARKEFLCFLLKKSHTFVANLKTQSELIKLKKSMPE